MPPSTTRATTAPTTTTPPNITPRVHLPRGKTRPTSPLSPSRRTPDPRQSTGSPGGGLLTRAGQWGEAAQPKAVAHHEHRAEGHSRARDERVEQAECGQRNGCDVVGEGPEEVALDCLQR